jgi:exopolysaccharide production protein ExoQ
MAESHLNYKRTRALIEFPSSHSIGIYICVINLISFSLIFSVLLPALPAEQITRFLFWTTFVFSLAVVVVKRDKSLLVVTKSPIVIALLLLPILYLPFSDNLTHALAHTTRLFMMFLSSVAVVLLMSMRTFFSILQLVTLALTVPYAYALYSNVSFEVVNVSQLEDILNYKNHVGAIGAVAGVCSAWMIVEKRRILFSVFGLIFALFVVFVLSHSATSMVIAVTGLCSLLFFFAIQRLRNFVALKYYIILILLFCVFIVYLMIDSDQILELLGRDPTLTGRSDIWAWSYPLIADRPIFGYGYEALNDPEGLREHNVFYVQDALTHLHNSWLNIAFQFGLVGVVLHLVAYVVIGLHGRALLLSSEFRLGALIVSLLSMLLVHSTVETSFMLSRGELSFLTFILLLAPLNSGMTPGGSFADDAVRR